MNMFSAHIDRSIPRLRACAPKILKVGIGVLILCVTGCNTLSVTVPMCEVLTNPKNYDGKEVVVSGWMVLEFENATLGCTNLSEEKHQVHSVWINFDLPLIQKHSPQFAADLKNDIDQAKRSVGGGRRDIIVKGRLKFSEEMLRSPETAPTFGDFGHWGSSSGEIIVTEILEYGPNRLATNPLMIGQKSDQAKAIAR